MTRVEIHVFDPGSAACVERYIIELVRSRTRYCQVSLCVDNAEQAQHWRQQLAQDHSGVEIFSHDATVPLASVQGEVLLSMCTQIAPQFSAFKQAIDVVADNDTARSAGRERYRFYKERGYPLRHINVKEPEALA